MNNGYCTNEKCPAARTSVCFDNKASVDECDNWMVDKSKTFSESSNKATPIDKKQKPNKTPTKSRIEWSGSPFQLKEIELVSRRGNPLMIATVGEVYAGKSSFLGMLHTLLIRGQHLARYSFAGSLTLLGWEELAAALRFHKGQATEQAPTPSDPLYYSLLHWVLRRNDGRLIDVLFPDASGEVFTQWAVNQADSNAENVRWIHSHADVFIFFIDCKALIEKRGAAVASLVDLANRLVESLNGRPLLVVWAKADFLEEIRPPVKQNLIVQLEQIFGAVPHFEISKVIQDEPDQRQLANLRVVDYALERINAYRPSQPELHSSTAITKDHFLLYRGG